MRSAALPPLSLHAWLRLDAVRRVFPADARRVLEVGAGQGSFGALLARRHAYVGLEPDAASCAVARERVGGLGTVLAASDEDFVPEAPFDLVCAFEVLEHLPDEQAALERWRGFLRPGGAVLVSVPAGAHRMAAADRRAGHFRRYDRGDLAGVLERAGLVDPVVVAYGFPVGYALEAVRNAVAARDRRGLDDAERTAASGRWLQPPAWAATATAAASLPFRLLQRPFASSGLGTGLVGRARVPD